MTVSICLPVNDPSQAGEARRRAVAWAVEQGCGSEATGPLAIAVAELARNLGLHTTSGGVLLVRSLRPGTGAFEILSLDRGPGMHNFTACMDDGYSTAGTAGTGLGAVMRAGEIFDVHTSPGVGTAILTRVGPQEVAGLKTDGVGLVSVPVKGETECGDTCSYLPLDGGRARLMVADGLGHGPLAAEASQTAAKVFEARPEESLSEVMDRIHTSLRSTRGAAVSIAEVDPGEGRCSFLGVGNVSGAIVSHGEAVHLTCMNGTAGATLPRLREFSYPWTADSMLVLNSDGLKSSWRLDTYAGLLNRHPALAAGILYRDFSRGQDDACVATLRLPYEHRT